MQLRFNFNYSNEFGLFLSKCAQFTLKNVGPPSTCVVSYKLGTTYPS